MLARWGRALTLFKTLSNCPRASLDRAPCPPHADPGARGGGSCRGPKAQVRSTGTSGPPGRAGGPWADRGQQSGSGAPVLRVHGVPRPPTGIRARVLATRERPRPRDREGPPASGTSWAGPWTQTGLQAWGLPPTPSSSPPLSHTLQKRHPPSPSLQPPHRLPRAPCGRSRCAYWLEERVLPAPSPATPHPCRHGEAPRQADLGQGVRGVPAGSQAREARTLLWTSALGWGQPAQHTAGREKPPDAWPALQ